MHHMIPSARLLIITVALASSQALSQSALTVSFTTTPAGGNYNPKNCTVVWVENSSGTFVKTVGRWAGTRKKHLVAWTAKAGTTDADAVSGATRSSHSGTVSASWNLTDKAGAVVPDGTYTLRMEVTDQNATSASQNNQGTFTFVKGPTPSTQNTSGGGFNAVSIAYTVSATNKAPTVATPAAATATNIVGTTVDLSALGADDNGEGALTYTWSSNVAGVTFSTNASNAGKATTATFPKVGAYTLTALIKDAGGLSVSSAVNVTVIATLTSLTVTPATAAAPPSGTTTFSATALDQFSQPLSPQPAFVWAVSGGGTITGGTFTAGSTPGGPYTVTATSGGKSKTATVNVASGVPPTIAMPAAASPATVTTTTTALSVLGADDNGEAALTYTWALKSGPAAVSFSTNASHAARATTATFTAAGAYTLEVTVADALTLSVKSSVNVTVNASLATLAVTPATAGVGTGKTQTFTASGSDQFTGALASLPTVTWSLSGTCAGSTVNAAGLFTAGTTPGGPCTVTAAAGGKSATATVTVANGAPPTLATPAAVAENPVTTSSITASVLGADATGEAGLVYTWSASPAGPSFSANGNNAAKSTTVTFNRAGSYSLNVTVRNPAGLTVSSAVPVSVVASLALLEVSPASGTVASGSSLQMTVSAKDQFGSVRTPAPVVLWSSVGAGVVSSTGLFTGGPLPGAAKVKASLGGTVGEASLTVGAPGADTAPPDVQLLTPAEGAQVSGIIFLRATAIDKGGVATVDFRVDGEPVTTVSTPAYEAHFDTTKLSNGSHVFDARATDVAGNIALSKVANVQVNNSASKASGCSAASTNAPWGLALALTCAALRRRRV